MAIRGACFAPWQMLRDVTWLHQSMSHACSWMARIAFNEAVSVICLFIIVYSSIYSTWLFDACLMLVMPSSTDGIPVLAENFSANHEGNHPISTYIVQDVNHQQYPRKLQHTRRAHPRQSPQAIMKGIPL